MPYLASLGFSGSKDVRPRVPQSAHSDDARMSASYRTRSMAPGAGRARPPCPVENALAANRVVLHIGLVSSGHPQLNGVNRRAVSCPDTASNAMYRSSIAGSEPSDLSLLAAC